MLIYGAGQARGRIVAGSRLLRGLWEQHRESGFPLRDLVLSSGWKPGPEVGAAGPFLLSITQFTPAHLGDLGDIWRASERLGDQLVEIEGAMGVLTYAQPGRRHVGSLSIWADHTGLARFVRLPYHVEIMNRYRPRGLPVRAAKWWADEYRVRPALDEGLRLLDREDGQRRVVRGRPDTAR